VNLRRYLSCCLVIFLLPLNLGRGLAECIQGPFEGDIEWANLIFAGTLDRSEVVRGPGGIITRLHFSRIRYIKGTGPRNEFVLAKVGGRIGDVEEVAMDQLDFRLGRRYVAYAHKGKGLDPSGYYALSSCGVNLFGIWAETQSGPQVVHMGNDGPILAIRDRYLLVSRTQSWESAHPENSYQVFERPPKRSLDEELRSADSTYAADQARQDRPGGVRLFGLWPHQDPGTRVTEGEFVDWLTRVVARNSGARKSR
jgi:hypothetical protein